MHALYIPALGVGEKLPETLVRYYEDVVVELRKKAIKELRQVDKSTETNDIKSPTRFEISTMQIN